MYTFVYFVLQFVAVAAILNVTIIVSSTTATLDCTLPCFSPDIRCRLLNITLNDFEGVTTTYDGFVRSTMNFSYPTEQFVISNLASDRTYYYCVFAINATNDYIFGLYMEVGDPVCGNFHTTAGIAMVSFLLCTYVSRVHNTHYTRLSNSQYLCIIT